MVLLVVLVVIVAVVAIAWITAGAVKRRRSPAARVDRARSWRRASGPE
jgi:hypothetical protein